MVLKFKKYYSHYTLLVIGLLLVLSIGTFYRMVRPGIFSMQDWHTFRSYEYVQCIQDLQLPCRWSPDASFGYGQPIFNFYGQFSYLIGGLFFLLGVSVLDSLKIVYILSLVLSAGTMFLLSKQIWKHRWSAFISSLLYLYAPYRAVDIYVRGALPEAFSFVLFPLILYFFNRYVQFKKFFDLWLFVLTFSLLVLTHNLSALMFLFFLVPWGIFWIWNYKSWSTIPYLIIGGLGVLGLTSFYIWPVVFESQYINLANTIQGYFDYHNHYVTLQQLLISNKWGYGASVWGDGDGLSLAIGYLQWIIPVLSCVLIVIQKRWRKQYIGLVLTLIGAGLLLMTHNKSTPIWQMLSPLAYLQFPWRFLGVALFSLALASGQIFELLPSIPVRKVFIGVLVVGLLALNAPFFREDIWFPQTDNQYFSGESFVKQTGASVSDYWPKFGSQTPTESAFIVPEFLEGTGSATLVQKNSWQREYTVQVDSSQAVLEFPMVYFPGWIATTDGVNQPIYPKGDLGLINGWLPRGIHQVSLEYHSTPIQTLGNIISLSSLLLLIVALIKSKPSFHES